MSRRRIHKPTQQSDTAFRNNAPLKRSRQAGNAGGLPSGMSNQAVQRMLQSGSLGIGAASDPGEAQAERVASRIVGSNGSTRVPAGFQARPPARTSFAAPARVYTALGSEGRPLDSSTRSFMEPLFVYDFSRVRVHNGPAAEQSTRELNARAYSVGEYIVLGARGHAPQTIAHELTHVVQRNAVGNSDGVVMRQPEPPGSPMPLAEPQKGPKVAPLELTDSDRKSLGDAHGLELTRRSRHSSRRARTTQPVSRRKRK